MRSKAVIVRASLLLVLIVMIPLGTVIAAGQPKPAAAQSGSDLFYNNCAACHGRDGKGNGPMGQVLTIRPADLTIIAKNTGGKFPAAKIYQLIDGRNPDVRGHGGPDMEAEAAKKLIMIDQRHHHCVDTDLRSRRRRGGVGNGRARLGRGRRRIAAAESKQSQECKGTTQVKTADSHRTPPRGGFCAPTYNRVAVESTE